MFFLFSVHCRFFFFSSSSCLVSFIHHRQKRKKTNNQTQDNNNKTDEEDGRRERERKKKRIFIYKQCDQTRQIEEKKKTKRKRAEKNHKYIHTHYRQRKSIVQRQQAQETSNKPKPIEMSNMPNRGIWISQRWINHKKRKRTIYIVYRLRPRRWKRVERKRNLLL